MGCLGVHFAITEQQAKKLLSMKTEEDVMNVIQEIEEAWDEAHIAESDKAWDAIHRCLSNGTLDLQSGEYPLNRCVFGGRQLCSSGDYYVSYVAPNEVRDVAAALLTLTKEWFRDRYFNSITNDYQGELNEEDFEYTWEWFQNVHQLYQTASSEGRAVIFTVDQ